MSAFSTIIPVTVVSPASTLYLATSQLVKVYTSGSGAAIYYNSNTAALVRVVVSETPAAIATASAMLVPITVTGGTIYLNANMFVSVVTDGGTGSIVIYYNPQAAAIETYEASETPAAIQTAIAAIVGSGGGSVTTGLTAFAGGGQASATQLSFGYNEVTTVATAGDSVKLQPAQVGAVITVLNDGANAMDVFPATSDTINDGAVNIAISVSPGNTVTFTAITGVNWESSGQTVRTGSIIVTGTTASTTKDTGSIVTEGGLGVELAIFAGTTINAGTALTVGTDVTLAKEVNHSITVAATTTADTAGGNVSVLAGNGLGTGAGGNVNIVSGQAGDTGNSGAVNVSTRDGGSTSGNSETISLATGDATVGGTGDIDLATGSTASGVAGDIILTPGTHTSATVSPMISLNKAVVKKPFSSSVASGATITGVQLVGGLIEGTGATGNWTLPTAAEITTAIGATPIGTQFDFTFVANGMTAANVATLLVGANMVVLKQTSDGDSAVNQLMTITNTSNVNVGVFRVVFDTATTCVISRIS